MPSAIPAACYIRVSTEDQTEYSPEAQRKALENYAAQHGMSIDPSRIYLDAGISGRRAATRPAFMAMIAAAKSRPPPFSVILVHKLDRFARSREDSIVYKSMLRRQCGIQVISVTEHLEDDRMGLILEAMLEAMAEYYSINLADEVRKGMREKARRGELQTTPPFGYRAENNLLVPVPEEAEVVRELYGRFLRGASLVSLARWAGRRGVLSHRGNPLDSRGVRYILSNPAYIGKLRWGTGAERGIAVADGGHLPIIDRETFQAAGALLRQNERRAGKHAQPAEIRRHWLAGLVKCAACGGGLILSRSRYLRCGRYVKGKCGASQHVPAALLEAAVLDRLKADGAGEGALRLTALPGKVQDPLADLARQIAATEKKLTRLREAYLCGAETAEEYRKEKEGLTGQLVRLREKEARIPSAADRTRQGEICRSLPELLSDPAVSVEAKYRAANAVLASCVWDRAAGKVTLTYRWGPECRKNP